MEEGRPAIISIFAQRMARNGREEELKAEIEKQRKTGGPDGGGLTYTPAVWTAMNMLGYEGPKIERALFEAYVASLPEKDRARARRARKKKARSKKMMRSLLESFEEAVRSCPVEEANEDIQWAWIRAHPAMSIKARSPDMATAVEITPEDILDAPHGDCPDQATARELQHWANRPIDFYKSSPPKKRGVENKVSEGFVKDMGLDEVRELLEQVKPDMENKDETT